MTLPIRFLLAQILYIRNKEFRPYMAQAGLSSGYPKILDYLSFCEGSTQKELAVGCGVEPATMSVLLDNLEKEGYIEKRITKENRRAFQIFFTEKGRDKHDEIRQKIDSLEEQAFKGFTQEEQELFQSYLERYYRNWCDESN
ncbi:transcriptional regulator [Desulfosporosinus orientis DSM 765]|uniref:Transcriptional regulator n=1 Tax=Desulfosporosinus orientis (strain ATCC 19365 / DSM 765 / NCIMB 8382 / VKM B-1628 / Singapore I) TaxID=768706 RepID=G7W6D0_DESOD|nr:MarR family transcriptional regulator [Desulfosporosinus orientis]AET68137.1 transcriptional regulator [Desulfosporosinus orientis DSM 765]